MTPKASINSSPHIHRLKPELHLADAFFWSPSQAELLREEILDDADWAEVVDQLDVLLRKGRGV